MQQQQKISNCDSSESEAHNISSSDNDYKKRTRRRRNENSERPFIDGEKYIIRECAGSSSSSSSSSGSGSGRARDSSSPSKEMQSAALATNSSMTAEVALARTPSSLPGDRSDEIMKDNTVTRMGSIAFTRPSVRNAAAGNSRRDRESTHQINVFVLVRLLFHYLEKVDPNLLLEAKAALKDCDRRKRNGDAGYACLSEAIPRQLRRVVGDKHWGRALAIQRDYLLQKQRKRKKQNDLMESRRHTKQSAVVSMGSTKNGSLSLTQQAKQQQQEKDEKSSTSTSSGSLGASRYSDPIFAPSLPLSFSQQPTSQNSSLDVGVSSLNPGLLHRIVVPGPFDMAQRALAAQFEAYKRASDQLEQEQERQQATAMIESVETQSTSGYELASKASQGDSNKSNIFAAPPILPSSPGTIAASAAAWQRRTEMASCSDKSSDSSNEKV